MYNNYTKLMAIVANKKQAAIVLKRANYLCKVHNAQLVIVRHVVDKSHEMKHLFAVKQRDELKYKLLETQKNKLKSYALTYNCPSNTVCDVVSHASAHKGLINLALAHKCDLIIKSPDDHNNVAAKLVAPCDWLLLRSSPMSVLLVKDKSWPENANIVSAIGLGKNDSDHQQLNELISYHSAQFSKLFNAKVHLSNAMFKANVNIDVPNVNSFDGTRVYNRENIRQKGIRSLQQQFFEPEANIDIHISDGLPEDVIPNICDEQDANLLIIGSIGRIGLKASLIGNTAEKIIDKINCDILVVKINDKMSHQSLEAC